MLDNPVSPGRLAPRGFTHRDGDYDGPMAHRLGEETLDEMCLGVFGIAQKLTFLAE